jgi:hypothetical protein
MNCLDALLMLLRWSKEGWEVHPIDIKTEFGGWI